MPWNHRFRLLLLILLVGVGSAPSSRAEEPEAASLPPPAAVRPDFARDIQPILAKHCYRCHGPQRQRGGLGLHVRARALAGGDGGTVIEPGRSAESRLVQMIAGVGDETRMPPEEIAPPLPAEKVALIRAWIDQGAHWPEDPKGSTGGVTSDHWAFQPPRQTPLPDVSDRAWPRNPIDRFVLARLEREGLRPAPEADRATLIRRLSLDLIGLPPTIAELNAFVADRSPSAYENLVERLLASPHYGERWGRRWLDQARYADTNGYEKDRERSIWPYRDWVIRALNDDMPFDRFTIEQIAGDMLPHATLSQRTATGFHRNTMINEEGGIDVEEFRFASLVDRVATTGTVWLGLTIQCAQCHSHKYDPITQREYYEFLAFLNNADEPEIDVPDPEIRARRAAIEAEIARREANLESQFPPAPAAPLLASGSSGSSAPPSLEERRRSHLEAAQAAWEKNVGAHRWLKLRPTRLHSRKHATMTVQDDTSVLVSGDKPNNDTYEVELSTDLRGITALRLEVLPDPSLPDGGPGRAPLFSVGDFLLTEIAVAEAPAEDTGEPRTVPVAQATADYAADKSPVALAIDGASDTGWSVKGGTGRAHAAVFELGREVGDGRPVKLVVTLRQDGIHQMTIGRFRLSATTDPRPVRTSGLPADVEALLLRPAGERTSEEQARVRAHFLSVAPELAGPNKSIAALRASLPRHPTTMVMEERKPEHQRTTHIHKRGEFLKPGEAVSPAVPSVLHQLPENAPRNRLTLARWLVADDNPLVGRVVMNQAWQAYFGRGLVPTADNFGMRGERPSHPELLDWLATEFRRQGWSQKAMHRMIVTSATYRQASRVSPQAFERDPKNELLARGPRFRVEAEVVRDVALAVSGLLNPAIGGPSVFPPQPDGVTALAYGSVEWKTSTGPDRYRRGLYTFTKRTAPYASFTIMDAPTSETACVRRERSNTPLQALTLLNDAVFVEASRALAARVLEEAPGDVEGRIRHLYRLCLSRTPDRDEIRSIAGFLERQEARFQANGPAAAQVAGVAATTPHLPERAAWTAVARAVLNLDETITKE
jgi:hypothetical protein